MLQCSQSQVAEHPALIPCSTPDVRRYIKFDTFHPAVERGLPVTRVISRITLQEILADATERLAGKNLIENSANVVGFEEVTGASGKPCVRVMLEDGRTEEGDILIGADGIWSKVRSCSHNILYGVSCNF